jgi:hypothetical protein
VERGDQVSVILECLEEMSLLVENALILRDVPRTIYTDLGSKLAATLLLQDRSNKILIPSREEWIGVGLLERDDELCRK